MSLLGQSCDKPGHVVSPGNSDHGAESLELKLTEEQMREAGITVGKLSLRSFEGKVRLLGRVVVSPQSRISVHAPAAGYVRQAPLQPGSAVRKGDLICVLEHPDYIVKQRELLEVKALLPFLEAEQRRKKELLDNEAGSLKNYQAASGEYERQRARYEGLKAELALLGFDVERIEREGQFQGQLVLRADVPGTVWSYAVNPGKFVEPNTPLAELIDVSHPWAEFQVYARHLPGLRPGMPLQVQVPGIQKDYSAVIHSIVPGVQEDTKTATLRAAFKQAQTGLVAGAALQADVSISDQTCWALPKESVYERMGGFFTPIQTSPGNFKLEPVQIECEDADWYGIRADTSKRYLTKGGYYLKDRF